MPFVFRNWMAPAQATVWLGLQATAWGALPKAPEGFEVRLVATVPAVQYPCQVGTAPDGALFVAEDPMDQVGPYEADHGRILLFRDGKEPVVYADGFRAIQGMAWHDGALYVSHMPYLTVLRDADGDDKAESRRDLFKDLGPTDNRGLNDHIVSGIQFGMDGYLYISVGDKGIPKATGPDGRTIQIIGGGVCRCRPDGTGLEVVSTGTRNHLEPNLDDRDDLFTYDNTDDGLGWWTRVTHHVDGGYYGYPFDYHDRPDRHLPRMAEFGGGSPCGGVLYKEDAWPEPFRGLAFWAEWGKGKVQAFRFAPDGATFKVVETIDFAVADGVANFRPIDLALSYDGRTLYVADWGMGGWANKSEKVGRVFAITAKSPAPSRPRGKDSDSVDDQIAQLDHPAFNERMRAQRALIRKGSDAVDRVVAALRDETTPALARRHLIWTCAALAGDSERFDAALADVMNAPVADLRAQALRALGLVGPPPRAAALRLVLRGCDDPDPAVRLQAVITLGRIGGDGAVERLLPELASSDVYIALSARKALQRINRWDLAQAGLNADDPKRRTGLLAAMEQVYDADAARALAGYAADGRRPAEERALALRALAQGHRKTRPWDGRWWGTRPAAGPPPAKVVDWEQTGLVLETVRGRLDDPAPAVRLAAAAAVRLTRDREAVAGLRGRLAADRDDAVRVEAARTLGALEARDALPDLIALLRAPGTAAPVRVAALNAVESIGSDLAVQALVGLLEHGDGDADGRTRVLAALGRFRARGAVGLIRRELRDSSPQVRAAAAEALGRIGTLEGLDDALRARLNDRELEVRKAALLALGGLGDREAIPAMIAAANLDETRFEATRALAATPDVLALQVYLAGLADKSPDLRKLSAEALTRIRTEAAPVLDQLAARRELAPALVPELRKIYNALQPIVDWRLLGPFPIDAAAPVPPTGPTTFDDDYVGAQDDPVRWRQVKSADLRGGMIDLEKLYKGQEDRAVFGYAEVTSETKRTAQLAVGSDDTLTVWVNGVQVYDFQDRSGFQPDQKRVEVSLNQGTNRILIKCGNRGGPWAFAVSVVTPEPFAFLKAPAAGAFDPDRYRARALKGDGVAERGRALFQDVKGLACIRCHAVGGEGGTVGPELSSVGAKYPREELIQSVLYPSARISSGYEPVVVAVADGRVLTGIIRSDAPEALEIEDADAKRVRIPREEIEERKRSEVSLMPTGLAEGLTPQDFADLIAYLETLKQAPTPAPNPLKNP